MKKAPGWAWALALVSGTALWLGAGVPFGLFPLAFVGLAPILWLFWQASTPGRAALFGLISGLIFYAFHLFWIPDLITDAPVPVWLLWLGTGVLILFEAAWWAGAGWLIRKLRTQKAWVNALLASSVWVLMEYIRGHLSDASFLWANTWMTGIADPLILRSAALLGPFGVAWTVVFINGLVVWAIWNRSLKMAGLAGIWVVMTHLTGLLPSGTRTVGHINIAIVQPNILADYRNWQVISQRYDSMATLLEGRDLDLVILSESALPGFFRYSVRSQHLIEDMASRAGAPVMLATADVRGNTPDRAYYNTAFLVDSFGVIRDSYDKVKLAPFGEHFPFHRFLPEAIKQMIPAVGDYSPGKEIKPIRLDPWKIGVLVCFESVFPDVSRAHVLKGSNILVNITNDGWFGKTLGPVEHFQLARFRAAEQSRFLLRCGKTGISAVVDDKGAVLQELPLFKQGVIFARVPLKEGLTPYARIGDWPVWFSALIMALILGYTVANKSRFRRKP